MDAAIPADAQNAPTGIWKSRTEREIPTAPTPIIVVVNERKNNGDSNSVAKLSTESDQAHDDALAFCLRAEQDYKVHLMCDPNHEWSIRETPAESEVMDLPDGPVPMPKEGETI